MTTYMILSNYTEQGIKTVKDAPERIKHFKEIAQSQDVKFLSVHLLFCCFIPSFLPLVSMRLCSG